MGTSSPGSASRLPICQLLSLDTPRRGVLPVVLNLELASGGTRRDLRGVRIESGLQTMSERSRGWLGESAGLDWYDMRGGQSQVRGILGMNLRTEIEVTLVQGAHCRYDADRLVFFESSLTPCSEVGQRRGGWDQGRGRPVRGRHGAREVSCDWSGETDLVHGAIIVGISSEQDITSR